MNDTMTEIPGTVPPGARIWTADEAFAYCARITSAHYENFPVASLFLPEEKRAYMQAIYAFSRTADDFADEGEMPPELRLQRLEEWGHQLTACYEGEASHPIFVALRETIKHNDIPQKLLIDLLSAFRSDVLVRRFSTFDDVLSYCTCSANPVGRMVLRIFGYQDEQLFALSDKICTGLQLANFWQDISVDRAKDRLYVPLEDLERFGYTIGEWRNGLESVSSSNLIKFQVERTRDVFFAGAELPSRVDRDLHIELKLVWLGGMGILRSIEKSGYRTVNSRPVISTPAKLLLLARALYLRDLTTYGKKNPWWDLTP